MFIEISSREIWGPVCEPKQGARIGVPKQNFLVTRGPMKKSAIRRGMLEPSFRREPGGQAELYA